MSGKSVCRCENSLRILKQMLRARCTWQKEIHVQVGQPGVWLSCSMGVLWDRKGRMRAAPVPRLGNDSSILLNNAGVVKHLAHPSLAQAISTV